MLIYANWGNAKILISMKIAMNRDGNIFCNKNLNVSQGDKFVTYLNSQFGTEKFAYILHNLHH
jgi:acyl-CoA thioesterase